MQELILGGVKSGKSRYAENQAKHTNQAVVYLATATADDAEMQQRIRQHQTHRPKDWALVEAPLQLAEHIQRIDQQAHGNVCILVECLTLWMTNVLTQAAPQLTQEVQALLALLPHSQADILLVSNETNMGIVPLDALSRRYCDEMGRLHQALAVLCDKVTLVVAGLPLTVKG